jgi:hypothetical protein
VGAPLTIGNVTTPIMAAAPEAAPDPEPPVAVELVEALEAWPGTSSPSERGLAEPWRRLVAGGWAVSRRGRKTTSRAVGAAGRISSGGEAPSIGRHGVVTSCWATASFGRASARPARSAGRAAGSGRDGSASCTTLGGGGETACVDCVLVAGAGTCTAGLGSSPGSGVSADGFVAGVLESPGGSVGAGVADGSGAALGTGGTGSAGGGSGAVGSAVGAGVGLGAGSAVDAGVGVGVGVAACSDDESPVPPAGKVASSA